MMKKVLCVFKPMGWTSLQAVRHIRKILPEYNGQKLGYAGTLDPMASGLLLILANEENKKRPDYLLLPKTYEFEVLFGVSTDTYDILGKIKKSGFDFGDINLKSIKEAVKSFSGEIVQSIPPYSAIRIKGKPLFKWARDDRLYEIEIKPRKRKVFNIKATGLYYVSASDLKANISSAIDKVKGNFRQKEIQKNWRKLFKKFSPELTFPVVKIKIKCAKGTYVRSIANDFGKHFSLPSLALSIIRTQIGSFSLKETLKIKNG